MFPRIAAPTGCREQGICRLPWDREVAVQEPGTPVCTVAESVTKTGTARIVGLNSVASRGIASRRGTDPTHVISYHGKPAGKRHSSAWRRAWNKADLPTEVGKLKGVHNLRRIYSPGSGLSSSRPSAAWMPSSGLPGRIYSAS
jgi:hypothetical protein